MTLQDWLRDSLLIKHTTSREEIRDLRSAAARDLRDSAIPGLSTDWRFNIAYNAALRLATAALAASGFRAARDQHHVRIIRSLELTVGADTILTDTFDRFRKKRNIGTYERAGIISDHEADEMHRFAETIRSIVDEWLKTNHPTLL